MYYLKVGVLQHEALITAVLYLHLSFKLTTMQSQQFYMVQHTHSYKRTKNIQEIMALIQIMGQ